VLFALKPVGVTYRVQCARLKPSSQSSQRLHQFASAATAVPVATAPPWLPGAPLRQFIYSEDLGRLVVWALVRDHPFVL
jgi:hypothetical protein